MHQFFKELMLQFIYGPICKHLKSTLCYETPCIIFLILQEKLQKTVNMRAMNMLGKAEEQYTSLINKKTTVENDKSKIRKVIEELDVKKKAELRAAWEKVNKDFGSIFAMLLPGKKHITLRSPL